MTKQSAERQRSYTVINPDWVQATILPRNPERADRCAVELREISLSGAKLLVHGPPELQYECRLLLESARLPQSLVIPAELQWARPNAAGDWLLGCGFEPPLTEEDFGPLFHSGILERRSAVRRPTRIAVEMQCQNGDERMPALVCDLSEGGLCLTTSRAPINKQSLSIFGIVSAKEVCVALQVRWSMHVGPNYFIGCEFGRRADFALLRKMQQADPKYLRGQGRLAPTAVNAECA